MGIAVENGRSSKNWETQLAYTYALSHLARLSQESALRIYKEFPSLESVQLFSRADYRHRLRGYVGEGLARLVNVDWDSLLDSAHQEIRALADSQIRVICLGDPRYPPLLRLIPFPPMTLFVKGDQEILTNMLAVAVIGTRNCTRWGADVAFRTAQSLVADGCLVVSGVERGIAAAAHQGTIEAGGKSVAIFGSPLHKIYPAENKELAFHILDSGGAWISELPLGAKCAFRRSRRIVVGLSVAILPIQTPVGGSTMQVAQLVESYARLLLCPEPAVEERESKASEGIIQLINSHRAQVISQSDGLNSMESMRKQAHNLLQGAAWNAAR
ncbi:MAG TPA: DNA-processing protein DprA [Candidatus Angelobacter sp.]|jgi:DNA protecting protein DprA|nr:DNA-processing protein DprA [Candidatus Angelobacter sp.]